MIGDALTFPWQFVGGVIAGMIGLGIVLHIVVSRNRRP